MEDGVKKKLTEVAVTLLLIDHFETVPNSWKLQTTEMWILKDFKIQIV